MDDNLGAKPHVYMGMNRNTYVAFSAAAVAALALSACSSNSSGSSSSPSTLTTTSSASVQSSSSAPSSSATKVDCQTTDFTLSLGAPGGAAGSVYYPLKFTKKTAGTCAIDGFPTLQFVSATGTVIGPKATTSGTASGPVMVSVGKSVSATVQIAEAGNFDPAACKVKTAAGLLAHAPGSVSSVEVKFANSVQACSAMSLPSPQLLVQAVK